MSDNNLKCISCKGLAGCPRHLQICVWMLTSSFSTALHARDESVHKRFSTMRMDLGHVSGGAFTPPVLMAGHLRPFNQTQVDKPHVKVGQHTTPGLLRTGPGHTF